MLVTEREAADMWCPLVRAPSTHYEATPLAAVNTGDSSGARGRGQLGERPVHACVGSACMLWRWGGAPNRMPTETPRGYCGIAGKPEAMT